MKAQRDGSYYYMHEDVDLTEAEWTRSPLGFIECEHDEDPEVIDIEDEPYFPDDVL